MGIDMSKIVGEIIKDDPELSKLFTRDKKLAFPEGLRYKYYTIASKGFQTWYACWSTTKNENDKFISWVYIQNKKTKVTTFVKVKEHKSKIKAKRRAIKIYNKRFSKTHFNKEEQVHG